MTLGDGSNDLQLVGNAGIGVAMGNAVDQVSCSRLQDMLGHCHITRLMTGHPALSQIRLAYVESFPTRWARNGNEHASSTYDTISRCSGRRKGPLSVALVAGTKPAAWSLTAGRLVRAADMGHICLVMVAGSRGRTSAV